MKIQAHLKKRLIVMTKIFTKITRISISQTCLNKFRSYLFTPSWTQKSNIVFSRSLRKVIVSLCFQPMLQKPLWPSQILDMWLTLENLKKRFMTRNFRWVGLMWSGYHKHQLNREQVEQEELHQGIATDYLVELFSVSCQSTVSQRYWQHPLIRQCFS